MSTITIFHNPRCSKSRQTLALLKEKGYQPKVVEYLKTPLSLEEIKALSQHFPLNEFVRTSEPFFKSAQLSLNEAESVLKAILQEPKLLQRPIVTYNGRARIGRPPEKVLEILP